MNGLDWKLLEYLASVSRAPAGEVADDVGTSPDLVEAQLEDLREEGYVSFYRGGDTLQWTITPEGMAALGKPGLESRM